ncbi:MAG TPA: aminoglycoside phosphotransferase family protein [Acidimicrobiales bacterium]
MAVLRRRGRRPDTGSLDPAADLDLDAVAAAVLDAAEAALGERLALDHGPEPVLGYGPDAYRVRLATADPRWSGTLLARTSDPAVLAREAAWLDALRTHGFPAAEPVAGPEAADAGVLVFRQPPGDSLATAMVANITAVPQFLAAFGQLHGRLHALPAGDLGVEDASGWDDPLDELVARTGPEAVGAEVAGELGWLADHRPGGGAPVPCHTELSPAYVYLEGTDTATATAVNWTRARLTDAAYDVAGTVTAFWSVPIYVDNALHRRALKMARDSLVATYLDAYRAAAPAPPDEDGLRYWQAFHVGWLIVDVVRRLHGVNGPWEGGTIVPQPDATLAELRDRFRELTA